MEANIPNSQEKKLNRTTGIILLTLCAFFLMAALGVVLLAGAADPTEKSASPGPEGMKCVPPKVEKPLKPISPGQKPVCEDITDEGPEIQLVLQADKQTIKQGDSTTICALAYDCDYKLTYCTYDNWRHRWLAMSAGSDCYSPTTPSCFSYTWETSKGTITPIPGTHCATYTSSIEGKDYDATVKCTVADVATLDRRDRPVTKKISIHVKKK
jgi:hypothetical protein